jgi:hypothetical protein
MYLKRNRSEMFTHTYILLCLYIIGGYDILVTEMMGFTVDQREDELTEKPYGLRDDFI